MDDERGNLRGGRYRMGELLGEGGCARVYDGYDTRLARPVAVKQLKPEVAADAAMCRRFEQEARTAARLTHPNAVAVFDTGKEDGRTYLVMERLPGRTLAHRIAEGTLAPATAAAIGVDVLAALQAAHSLGMVHRDVKPGNILLTDDERAKVTDFGIAKSVDPAHDDETAADATVVGLVVGTPAYLAPERLAGRPATPQTDLYALGVVLYEAITGAKPELGPTEVPGAPPDLAAVILRALSLRPADRYASAAQMAQSLRVAAGPTGASVALATASLGGPLAVGATRPGSPPARRTDGPPSEDPTVTSGRRRSLAVWWRRTARRRPVVVATLLGIAALGSVAVAATGATATGASSGATGSGSPHAVRIRTADHLPDAASGTTTTTSSTTTTSTSAPPAAQTVSQPGTPGAATGQVPAGHADGHPTGGPGHGADGQGGPGHGADGQGGPAHGPPGPGGNGQGDR